MQSPDPIPETPPASATAATPPDPTEGVVRVPNPLILIAITIGIGIVVGTAMGMYVGRWTYGNVLASCDRADWCEFNAGLGAVVYGMIAGAIAYVASGLAIIFGCRRSGHRVGYILGHMAATPVVALLLTVTVLKLFYT